MFSRRLLQLAAAGVAAAGCLVATAGPAAAAVTYDPIAKTGFVDLGDVQRAFGWTAAKAKAKAPGVVFNHEFWSDDTYSVSCGKAAFPVVHHREYGRYELTDTVAAARDARGARSGYARKLLGFRITGPYAGISGTSVPPVAGQPCPEPRGATIVGVRKVSSLTGWALTATSGTERRELLVRRTPVR